MGNNERTLTVFDGTRLPRAIAVDIERLGCFAVDALLVAQNVTREQIESAVSRMAE